MAQTLNYLTEYGLLDYADLTVKADEAAGCYHELSGKSVPQECAASPGTGLFKGVWGSFPQQAK